MFTIRPANHSDVDVLQQIIHITHDARTTASQVRRALDHPQRMTLIAEVDGQPAGFCDAFLTLDAHQQPRWEVDLLSVLPIYRGRGIARSLVNEVTTAGKTHGALLARALVAVANSAAQHVFSAARYTRTAATCHLLVRQPTDASVRVPAAASPSQDTHYVMVDTLSYRGIWLEGPITPAAATAALMACKQHSGSLIGTLIPDDALTTFNLCRELGFELIGEYQWWKRSL